MCYFSTSSEDFSVFIFDENLIFFVPNNSRKQAPFRLDECLMERVGSPLGAFFYFFYFSIYFYFYESGL